MLYCYQNQIVAPAQRFYHSMLSFFIKSSNGLLMFTKCSLLMCKYRSVVFMLKCPNKSINASSQNIIHPTGYYTTYFSGAIMLLRNTYTFLNAFVKPTLPFSFFFNAWLTYLQLRLPHPQSELLPYLSG